MKEGLFWVVGNNKECLGNGNFEIIKCFEHSATHVDVWEKIKHLNKKFNSFDFEYFPRGRIWFKNDIAIMFINPIINIPTVIDKIKLTFELENIEIYEDGFTPKQIFERSE